MTEKTYTIPELNELTNTLWLQYIKLFEHDKMSFHDYLLLENVFMKIQRLYDTGMEAFEWLKKMN